MKKAVKSMKRIKKLSVMLLCCLLLSVIAMPVSASAAKLNKKSISLNVGKIYTLKASGTKEKITWTSSKKSVATVSSKGVVKAKKKGTAVITAKYGKKKLKCTVTVKKAKTVINKSTLKGTWEVDVPMTVKVNKTSIRWIYGSAFYYGNAMKFANNGSFLYYVGAGNGGKGSYKIGSNSITYSVRTYEEGSLEKGTIKVIKGKNIRLMTRYDIYKIYWKKK